MYIHGSTIQLSSFRPGCLIEVWLRGRLDPDDARPVPEVGERVCLAAENFAMEEMGRQPLKERQRLCDVRYWNPFPLVLHVVWFIRDGL